MTDSDLLVSDGVIVGSPVYFGNMSGEVKTFFDNWSVKFGLSATVRCVTRSGGRSPPASQFPTEEVTIMSILSAMFINQMVVVSGGGFGATAATGPDSPGIDEKELGEARELGKRIAEVTAIVKRGATK